MNNRQLIGGVMSLSKVLFAVAAILAVLTLVGTGIDLAWAVLAVGVGGVIE